MREQDKQKVRSGQNKQKVRGGQDVLKGQTQRNGGDERKVQGGQNVRNGQEARDSRKVQTSRDGQNGRKTQTPRSGRDMSKGRTRTESLCPVEKKCGGCGGFSQSYEQHLKQKEKNVQELCKTVKKWEPIMGMETPYHYRNKVHAVFGEDRRHNVISGTYEEKTHRIVPMDSCMLDDPRADAIIVSVRGLLKSFKIRPYNEDTGYGLFRHVLVRTGYHTGQIMVVLVLASPVMPSKNNFVKALLKLHPEITTVVLNVNGRGTSMVLGEKEHVLYGKGYIEDTLCGKTFRISAQSFYQVNPEQTERLYAKAVEYAGLTGAETVLDAYCGTGTIGLIAAGHAKEVIGVELNRSAVRDAKINAKTNNVTNISFYENDAGKFMVEMAEQGANVDVVFMDPPRAGSDEAFLSSLVRLAPARVVYVSCNPETLARDLQYLTRNGYRALRATPVDMFPWTGHVETVVLLGWKGIDDYMYVNYAPDHHVIQGGKATYKEITEWIQETYGAHVTNLNIAQVKDKCGFEKRENYNKGTEGHRVPKCTPEKEQMIMSALKHFNML